MYTRGLVRYFSPPYGVRTARTVEQAKTILRGDEHFVGAIIDVGLPDGSGIDVLAAIRELGLSWPVLIITGFFEVRHAAAAQLHGAEFLPKRAEQPRHLAAFMERLREHAGKTAVRERAILDRYAKKYKLTSRELEVLTLGCHDLTREEIIAKLGIKEDTVKSHVRSLIRKTGYATLDELSRRMRRVFRGDLPEL
ncbi:LuxR C-terminal-related transcriptional regulator [Myxococcota bacterium]|nr:LuxR C-terminal-related transcriptional regulator [Myxococcota bacterium]